MILNLSERYSISKDIATFGSSAYSCSDFLKLIEQAESSTTSRPSIRKLDIIELRLMSILIRNNVTDAGEYEIEPFYDLFDFINMYNYVVIMTKSGMLGVFSKHDLSRINIPVVKDIPIYVRVEPHSVMLSNDDKIILEGGLINMEIEISDYLEFLNSLCN